MIKDNEKIHATTEKNCYNCQLIRANLENCIKVVKNKDGIWIKEIQKINPEYICEQWEKHWNTK